MCDASAKVQLQKSISTTDLDLGGLNPPLPPPSSKKSSKIVLVLGDTDIFVYKFRRNARLYRAASMADKAGSSSVLVNAFKDLFKNPFKR